MHGADQYTFTVSKLQHSLFSECNYSLVLNFESLGGKFKEQKYNNTCYMKPNPHHGKNKVIIWYTVDTSWPVWRA